MLKKVLVNLAGSLYQREASPTFVLQDGVLVPNETLVNARHHNGKLVFDQGYENNKAHLIAGGGYPSGGYSYPVVNVTSRTATVESLVLPDNIVANFSYDTNVTETSGYVTSWKDATGNFEFLGSASYVYGPQKVTGALHFAHSRLITAASLEASTGPTTQFTLIYVYKSASMTGAINGAVLLTCGNQENGVQRYILLSTTTFAGSETTWNLEFSSYNDGQTSTVTTIPRVDSSYRIIFVTYDNGVVNCYDGNTLAGTITCPVTFNTRDASLGVIAGREWGENTYNHPDLYVKEFDFYDRVLTSDERSLAIEYLKSKYSI